MSQRGGFRGGGRKGRDRSSPYNTWKDRPGRNWGGKKAEGDGPKQAKGVSEEVRTPEKGPGGAAGASLLATPDAVDGTSVKPVEKKFSNKARLFVGNLPRDFTEEQLRKLFAEHGEVQEVYVHKEKSFGFVRMVSAFVRELPSRHALVCFVSGASPFPSVLVCGQYLIIIIQEKYQNGNCTR